MRRRPPRADQSPTFKDVAFAKGVTAHRPYTGDDLRPSTAWHAQFDDVNNDGLVDLLVVKGNVAEMPDFAMTDPNNLLLQGAEGKFTEAGLEAGISNNGNSRGGALADFNMDGLLDLVVTNRWKSAQVWRNTSTGLGNWIEFQIKQPAPNVDAVGGWLEVTRGDAVMRRETDGGRRPGRRPARLVAFRPRRQRRYHRHRDVAGRHEERVDRACRQRLLRPRARQAGRAFTPAS